jgi:hypothetical protein
LSLDARESKIISKSSVESMLPVGKLGIEGVEFIEARHHVVWSKFGLESGQSYAVVFSRIAV